MNPLAAKRVWQWLFPLSMSKVKRVLLSYYTLDRYLVKMVKIDISKIMYGLVRVAR